MKKFILIGLILFIFVGLGLKYQELETKKDDIQKAINNINRRFKNADLQIRKNRKGEYWNFFYISGTSR